MSRVIMELGEAANDQARRLGPTCAATGFTAGRDQHSPCDGTVWSALQFGDRVTIVKVQEEVVGPPIPLDRDALSKFRGMPTWLSRSRSGVGVADCDPAA